MTLPTKKLNICLVTTTLSGGGAERVAADLSLFFEANGHQVTHVVFAGKIEYQSAGKIHHLVNTKNKNNIFSLFERFLALRKIFKNNNFDAVIDFRTKEKLLQELIIHNFVYPKFIQTVHSFRLTTYLPKSTFLTKLLYKNAIEFVSVSKKINFEIEKKYGFKSTHLIYNPINTLRINNLINEKITEQEKFILAVGSLHKNVKQFDVLINCYTKSVLPKNNIKLIILGEGKLKEKLITLVKNSNLSSLVELKGSIENPFTYYKNALFTVSSSKYEGFPMVFIESLFCETPVVSWDFNSGPSEIIETGENGILVENQNQEKLIEAMNKMITDTAFYNACKKGARESVAKFDLEIIGKQWLEFLESK